MPIRFAHLGDLHLGPNARNVDRIRALDQIIDECVRARLAAWLWPGDLNHSLMTVHDKNVLTARVIRMANHAPVVIVYGNHDVPGDLDFLAKLQATYPIYVIASPIVLRVPLPVEISDRWDTSNEAAIFCFPYPTRMGLVAAGTPPDRVVAVAREALDYIFIGAAAELTTAVAEGCIPLMIGHVNVGGASMSSGQPNIGKEIELDPTMLDRLGPIYKGLNHIHKAQEIGGAWFAGSGCRLDWGETEDKRYLTIDYSQPHIAVGTPDFVVQQLPPWEYTVTAHPIDVAPMFHVEGVLTPSGFQWDQDDWMCPACHGEGDSAARDADGETLPCAACLATPGRRRWDGCEVRVRFRYVAAERGLLDFEAVKALFPGALKVVTDPIPTHTQAIRAPEVVAAVTLEQKVAAFIGGRGEDWTPALEEKLARLQQLDGPAFFTSVSADLVCDDAEVAEDTEHPFMDDGVPSC